MPGSVSPRISGVSVRRPSEDAVRGHVNRVLESSEFRNSHRMRRFLTFVVETTLASDTGELKEHVIGTTVFDRCPSSYDPRTDPIVRNEARRLRRKLELYYECEGRSETVRIEVPKGGYVPVFLTVQPGVDQTCARPPQTAVPVARWKQSRTSIAVAIAAGVSVCVSVLTWTSMRNVQTVPTGSRFEARQEYTVGRRMLTDEDLPKHFAFSHLERAIQLDPTYADAYAGLGIAYSMAVTRGQLAEAGNWSHAKQLFSKALALDQDSAEAYAGAAALEASDANFSLAERLFRKSISIRPGDAFTHFVYARLLLLPLGRLDEAASQVQESIHLDPTSAFRSVGLCSIQLYRGDWSEALIAAREAMQGLAQARDLAYDILAEGLCQIRPRPRNSTTCSAGIR